MNLSRLAKLFRLQDDQTDEIVEDVVGDLPERLSAVFDVIRETFGEIAAQVWSVNGAVEVGVLLVALVIAWLLRGPFRALLERLWPGKDVAASKRGMDAVSRLALPIVWLLLLWIGGAVIRELQMATNILRIAVSLLNAWIVIQLVASLVRDRTLGRLLASLAWIVAALNILGLLGPTLSYLNTTSFPLAGPDLTLLKIIKGLLLAVLFVWVAAATSGLVRASLQRSQRLTPSVQNLVAQGARLGLLFLAIVLALSAIGIDLTVFAVFSGAIGVGIGFGLQSIFSNLMAGIILLLEKSVKVGDFIEFDNGLAGEVREINIRATLVTTNDNVDILVPNEEFIKTRVTNWTLREGFRRTRIPFGVAYGTDKDLVRKAALEATENVPHMLTGPGAKPAQVWLTGFGDSSLDFELVVWLRPESVKRPAAVAADYNWAIETALGKYGIEIPFPQRDLHIRSGLPQRIDGGE